MDQGLVQVTLYAVLCNSDQGVPDLGDLLFAHFADNLLDHRHTYLRGRFVREHFAFKLEVALFILVGVVLRGEER